LQIGLPSESKSRDGVGGGVPLPAVAYPSKVIKRKNTRIPDLLLLEVVLVCSFQIRKNDFFYNNFFCSKKSSLKKSILIN
jgi:hypothetical protein